MLEDFEALVEPDDDKVADGEFEDMDVLVLVLVDEDVGDADEVVGAAYA
jgi:hypothetical protein